MTPGDSVFHRLPFGFGWMLPTCQARSSSRKRWRERIQHLFLWKKTPGAWGKRGKVGEGGGTGGRGRKLLEGKGSIYLIVAGRFWGVVCVMMRFNHCPIFSYFAFVGPFICFINHPQKDGIGFSSRTRPTGMQALISNSFILKPQVLIHSRTNKLHHQHHWSSLTISASVDAVSQGISHHCFGLRSISYRQQRGIRLVQCLMCKDLENSRTQGHCD